MANNCYELTLNCPAAPSLKLGQLYGQAALNQLFDYTLTLYTKDTDAVVSAKTIVDQPASCLARDDGEGGGRQEFNGIITEFSLIREFFPQQKQGQSGGSPQYFNRYRARLRPRLWRLTQSQHCRFFHDKTALEIITPILQDAQLDLQNQCRTNYRKRPHCVQYHESDFAFISRLMEEEGICYFFQHEDNKDQLVLADNTSKRNVLLSTGSLTYRDQPKRLLSWQTNRQKVSSQHQVNSYTETNFTGSYQAALKQPTSSSSSLKLSEKARVQRQLSQYADHQQSIHYANIAQQRADCQSERTRASARQLGICPGSYFQLEAYPLEHENTSHLVVDTWHHLTTRNVPVDAIGIATQLASIDQGFYNDGDPHTLLGAISRQLSLVTARLDQLERRDQTNLLLTQKTGALMRPGNVLPWTPYWCEFTVQPQMTPWRPAQQTPKPRAIGPQIAKVYGNTDKEPNINKDGCIQVEFPWEQFIKDKANGQRTWLRMLQPFAGNGMGASFWPRAGQEVLVDFVDGDIDQPVVVGCLYNQTLKPIYPTSELPQILALKTRSLDGAGKGEGYNELRFYDKAGDEEVFLHAQKDKKTYVREDDLCLIDGSRHTEIHKDALLSVKGDQHSQIGGKRTEHIDGDSHLKLGGQGVVSANGNLSWDSLQQLTLKATKKLSGQALDVVFEAEVNLSLKVGESFITLNEEGVYIFGPSVNINTGGSGGSAGSAASAQSVQPPQLKFENVGSFPRLKKQ